MTTIAAITLPAETFALAETMNRLPDVAVRVESVVAEGPARTMPLVWFTNATSDDVEAALEADPSIERYHQLLESSDDGGLLYRLQYGDAAGSICRTIYDHDGTVLEAQIADGRWTIRLLFPHREDLSGAVSAIESRGIHVDVRRMVDACGDEDLEKTAALTEPQQEAIAEAYRQGYYDVPREISLEELASKLDISHQALSERLRRANRVLAGEQLDGPAGTVAKTDS